MTKTAGANLEVYTCTVVQCAHHQLSVVLSSFWLPLRLQLHNFPSKLNNTNLTGPTHLRSCLNFILLHCAWLELKCWLKPLVVTVTDAV